jgi:putative transposase
MVNDCIRVGLENNAFSMKRLCQLSYHELDKYDILSYYKLCAISRAAGILAARKKSMRRGIKPQSPYSIKLQLVSCYGFKIRNNTLQVPIGDKQYFDIPLSKHSIEVLPNFKVRSFTLTTNTVSITYSKEIDEIETTKTAGIDRNLRNLTYGNWDSVTHYDLSQAVEIAETTKDVIKSFKRNDVRIRKKLASKYGIRRKNRINQMLHRVSKHIVAHAVENKQAIVFEDIRRIRRLYQKGNGQGRQYRGMMNSWPFHEIKRQIEYKAKWEGILIVQLSAKDTRGTSTLCPQCGERLQEDRRYHRQLWCPNCKRWQDRDVVAVMNLSLKGLLRFGSSKGIASEAMVQESASKEVVILKVDAMNLTCLNRHKSKEPLKPRH